MQYLLYCALMYAWNLSLYNIKFFYVCMISSEIVGSKCSIFLYEAFTAIEHAVWFWFWVRVLHWIVENPWHGEPIERQFLQHANSTYRNAYPSYGDASGWWVLLHDTNFVSSNSNLQDCIWQWNSLKCNVFCLLSPHLLKIQSCINCEGLLTLIGHHDKLAVMLRECQFL